MTLLDDAKKRNIRSRQDCTPTDDAIELAIALLRREVTQTQAAAALNMTHSNNMMTWAARVLKGALADGTISVQRTGKTNPYPPLTGRRDTQ